MPGSTRRIGVLALQGDVTEHVAALERLGAAVGLVRLPDDLDAIDGLVIPGGESTTLMMLIDSADLRAPLSARLEAGMPALGTCAGMILLSTEVLDGRADQLPFGAIDISVRRNAFGRQSESFEADIEVRDFEAPMHAVFIRAPAIERLGPGVEQLSKVEVEGSTRVVLARQGVVTVTSFHPELAGDDRLHQLLLNDCSSGVTRS
ncbi:MAG TPA: pyridoxal 5'-phosphate synthase glutaminase subunit PdxT [Acidimicrobiales bacterium]